MHRTDRIAVPRLFWVPETGDAASLRAAIERATSEPFDEPIGLWLRFASRPLRESFALLGSIRPLCTRANVRVLVGGRVDLAIAADADGVHLPSHGLSVEDARRLVPESMLVGASCHDASELAAARDADYVTLSPVHPVPGKAPPIGFDGLAALVAASAAPAIALGGIRETDVGAARATGAHGVAVARGITRLDEAGSLRRFLLELRAPRVP